MRTKADPAKILARLNELGPAYLQAMIASNGGTNEQGEIADILKATIEYGKGPIDPVHLTEEIGDALWRLSQLADAFGIKLEDCMRANIEKLKRRYPDTFTDYLAANRNLKSEREALESLRPTPHGSSADEAFSMLFEKGGTLRTSSSQPNLSSVSESGFTEPTEVYDESIEYPLDSEGKLDTVGWTFGIPTLPGDYDWFSPIHSLDPRKITTHRGYNGNPGSWGRKVYWRKAGPEAYPGWTFAIPIEAGKYEWFYSYEPFNYRVSLIEVKNFSFTSVEVYFRKLNS